MHKITAETAAGTIAFEVGKRQKACFMFGRQRR